MKCQAGGDHDCGNTAEFALSRPAGGTGPGPKHTRSCGEDLEAAVNSMLEPGGQGSGVLTYRIFKPATSRTRRKA